MNRAKHLVPPCRLLARLGGLTLAAALLFSVGCEKEDTIRVYNAPKDAAPDAGPAMPVAAAGKPIDFATPQGWVEAEHSPMEFVHFKISADDPTAAVTLTPLATGAGSLLANVNRWQRQLKLPESPESDLAGLVKDLDLPAGQSQLIDLTGPEPADGVARGQRTVAVILPHGERTWYLKLSGPVALVEAQRSTFDEFLKSVKFPEEGDSGDTPAASAKPIDFATPQGWVEAEHSPMEFVHFKISADDPKAAVTLTPLATRAGSLLANVNRWQRQLKLPESPESDLPQLVKDIDLPAGKAQLIDLTGPEPADGAGPRQQTVAVILPHGERTWYLKLSGPVPVVKAQRSNFGDFLKSVKFPEGGGDAGNEASAGSATEPSPPEKLAKWTAPADWKPQEISADSPLFLYFKVESKEKPGVAADVAVTSMGLANLDVLKQDITIWRGQAGLPAQDDKRNGEDSEKVTLSGGKEALMFDFAGPQADKPEKRVVVALIVRGREVWFFKLLGPADLVTVQKPGFLSFVQSAEFAP